MKTLKLLLTVATFAFLASCSTEDGADGADGQPGAPGTANVIYSGWITAPASAADTIDGTAGISTTIDAPGLSQDILDKGTILVYFTFGSGTYSLPYTSMAGGNNNTITAICTLNKIKIFRFVHVAGQTSSLGSGLQWRYVLIPGGVAATGKGHGVNYAEMSYEEVCMSLNIQP